MARKKILIRTDSDEFGSRLARQLTAKGAKVKVTNSLNEVGEALLVGSDGKRPLNPNYFGLNDTLLQTYLRATVIAFGGGKLYDKIYNRQPEKYDFVIFDPFVSGIQQVDAKFQDAGAREVGMEGYWKNEYGVPDTDPDAWEKNYLSTVHYLRGSEIDLPAGALKGLVFIQEMKEAARDLWYGSHPNFPYAFASNDKRVKKFAQIMRSKGFVDYSEGGIKFDVNELEIKPEDRESIEALKEYMSSGARTAIAASTLTFMQPAIQTATRLAIPSLPDAAAYAQTTNVHSTTGSKGNDDIIIVTGKKGSAGVEYKDKIGNDDYSGVFRLPIPQGAIVFVADNAGKWEAKFHPRVGNGFELDLAAGSSDLFHTGVLYNRNKPAGFGVSYMQNDNRNEIRGIAWFYKGGIFAGAMKGDNKLNVVVGHPAEKNGNAFENYFQRDLESGAVTNEFVYGNETGGRMGMDFSAPYTGLFDGRIFGTGSFNVLSPIRPIVVPVGWRVKDFGADYIAKTGPQGTSHDFTMAKYLNHNNFVQVGASVNGNSKTLKIDVGRSGNKLFYNAGVGYDLALNKPIGYVEFNLKF